MSMARAAADALAEKKGFDIVLLDVADLITITDVFVIATGSSRRHVRTLAENVREKLAELGRKQHRSEGLREGEWVLLDYGDVVVHILQSEPRDFYGLERLWGDAPRVSWEPAAISEG